jgi:hypothetical protein
LPADDTLAFLVGRHFHRLASLPPSRGRSDVALGPEHVMKSNPSLVIVGLKIIKYFLAIEGLILRKTVFIGQKG